MYTYTPRHESRRNEALSTEAQSQREKERATQRAQQREPEKALGIRKKPQGLRGSLIFLITGGGGVIINNKIIISIY